MTDERSAAQETCGCWVGIAGEEFWCAREVGHPNECLPFRSEVMDLAARLEEVSSGLHNAVMAIDQDGGWPYEGPTPEEEPDA